MPNKARGASAAGSETRPENTAAGQRQLRDGLVAKVRDIVPLLCNYAARETYGRPQTGRDQSISRSFCKQDY